MIYIYLDAHGAARFLENKSAPDLAPFFERSCGFLFFTWLVVKRLLFHVAVVYLYRLRGFRGLPD